MFFGIQILGKKQPLSTAWLLGCGRKIGKKKIMREDILRTCDMIMSPVVPLALRLSAILMSGVILIFHQKQQYILDDARSVRRRSRKRHCGADRATSASTVRLKSGVSRQATSRTHTAAKTEDTVTFRSTRCDETRNEVSKHVEEIFLQEFLSTQPESSDLGQSLDKRSLEYFSSGSALKAREDSSMSYSPHRYAGGVRSSLESQQLDIQIGEDTFMPMPDEGEGNMPEAFQDDMMKDFFFTTDGQQQVSQPADVSNADGPHVPEGSAVLASEDRGGEQEAEVAQVVNQKKPARGRKRKSTKVHLDRSSISLPRETIRDWLRDASDIICSQPLLERRNAAGKRKSLKSAAASSSSILREACAELLDLFSADPSEDAAAENSEGQVNSDGNIEMEILRQQDGNLSPRRVSDAVFYTSSEEEGGVRDVMGEFDQDNPEFVQAPFLLPPTDEFVLPETNEADQLDLPLGRQYENIAFTPLRLPTQPSQTAGDSPYDFSAEARTKVLDFFASQSQGDGDAGSAINFSRLMSTHSIKRSDVARVFFHTLVLHSRGEVRMAQTEDMSLLVNVLA
ncbi:hypothetical protein A3770_04p29090 [Chloropicon primus]|uniref:Rad21/Rec8-like protein N-terminal domain-containing protein n=1 Tax=Chloropicon primus TaxID=1764295 RepID=A0A5B8MJD8_9CHLO|nr:hypothetical protein A3770_04p29090 [Chloropicon primus]|eukprot:QDZ20391.1 hypothetical protein A3770_04p29090 [Chloropicon primus]